MEKLVLQQANKKIELSRPDKRGYVYIEIDDGDGPNDILLSQEQLMRLTLWLNEYHAKRQQAQN